MPILRALLFTCLTGLCLHAYAKPDTALPAIDEVQQSIDGLADGNLSEAEQKNLRVILKSTLTNLQDIADVHQQMQTLQDRLKTAPQTISHGKSELASLDALGETPDLHRYARSDLAQLQLLLTDRTEQLSKSQQALTEANSIFINAQSRPERAQSDINRMLQRTQEINVVLASDKENGKPLSEEKRTQLLSEKRLIELQANLLKAQMSSNDILLDLGTTLRDLEITRSKRLDQEMLELQNMISNKRREDSEKSIEKLSLEARSATPDSLFAKEAQANLTLSTNILETTDQLSMVNRRSLQVHQQIDSVNQTKKSLDENINALKGSLLLARILYQQKKSLEDIQLEPGLADQIADIRLRQFDITQQREQLNNPKQYLEQLLAQTADANMTPAMVDRLREQIKTHSELLERYNSELNTLLNASIGLQLAQTYLQGTSSQLRDTLDEQMFWVPSNKHMTFSGLLNAPQRIAKQLRAFPLGKGYHDFANAFAAKPWVFIPVLLLILGLIWQRKTLKEKLANLNKDIGHFKRDSQLHTPLAVLLNLLLALPVALFLALAGFALQLDGAGQNLYLADAMFEIAKAWLVLYTSYCLLKPGGVAERHFHWQRDTVLALYNQLRSLGLLVIPLLFIATVAEHQPENLSTDNIGVLLVMVGFLGMSIMLWRIMVTGHAAGQASLIRRILGFALALLPVALVIAIGMGYYYTALKLTGRLIDTLYVVMIWILIETVMMRGLSVAARRLAYSRAVSKREQVIKEGAEGGEFIEEPTLDMDQVNEQSMRLIRLALYGVLALALYWVWADLLSVFSYLDNFTLYQYSSGAGATASMVPLSLGDLLGALLIVALTIALASNLPGLLEVLVLSRMNLARGSSYAMTTLLSYVIYAVGIVSTLGVMGLSWDKLQWLVAALSLGIGFGMQEIVANFISGLIVLFERPVRIGDTVTIGALSGTVSRIQIRATTITDFDRKEIIVPNKTFITDQLINWSLSDTVTRLVLTIGLAYEADLALARKLIMKIVNDHPLVLADPEPQLFFMNIGASTFNYDLRFHVRDLADRLPATDEILTAIAMSFRENNVEMAFNQMDIFVKNMQGQEAKLESKQANLPSAGPMPAPSADNS